MVGRESSPAGAGPAMAARRGCRCRYSPSSFSPRTFMTQAMTEAWEKMQTNSRSRRPRRNVPGFSECIMRTPRTAPATESSTTAIRIGRFRKRRYTPHSLPPTHASASQIALQSSMSPTSSITPLQVRLPKPPPIVLPGPPVLGLHLRAPGERGEERKDRRGHQEEPPPGPPRRGTVEQADAPRHRSRAVDPHAHQHGPGERPRPRRPRPVEERGDPEPPRNAAEVAQQADDPDQQHEGGEDVRERGGQYLHRQAPFPRGKAPSGIRRRSGPGFRRLAQRPARTMASTASCRRPLVATTPRQAGSGWL